MDRNVFSIIPEPYPSTFRQQNAEHIFHLKNLQLYLHSKKMKQIWGPNKILLHH